MKETSHMIDLDQTIEIKLCRNSMVEKYRKLGYVCDLHDNLHVKIRHLTHGCVKPIPIICDECGTIEFKRCSREINNEAHFCSICAQKEKGRKVSKLKLGVPNPKIRGKLNPRYRPDKNISYEEEYSKIVSSMSSLNYNKFKDIINPNNLDRGCSWLGATHHLDHIVSVHYGMMNDIDPRIISSPHNLRMLTTEENLKKKDRCDMTIEELINLIQNSDLPVDEFLEYPTLDILKKESEEVRKARTSKRLAVAGSKGGSKTKNNGTGIFKKSKEERSKLAIELNKESKELKRGIFGLTKEQLSEQGKRGAAARTTDLSGFVQYNDGTKNLRYMKYQQEELSFEEFLIQNPHCSKGYLSQKTTRGSKSYHDENGVRFSYTLEQQQELPFEEFMKLNPTFKKGFGPRTPK